MTGQSIVDAAKTIIQGLDLFEQVEDIDAVPFVLYPQSTPACILQLQRENEQPITFGKNQVSADLDAHVWNAVAAPTSEESEAFRGTVNSLVARLRRASHLDGLADVAGESQILIAGRRLNVQFTRPIVRPSRTWLHAVVTNRIVEIVNAPTS
jgi:hypothetical protein